MNYYNEFDPNAAATLRELIEQKHIAPGVVDERSIEDVKPSDLRGFTQVHLFAGFGLWSLAFRWGGIPDSEPAWSCSCPCQPFSAAGEGKGFADERHLWPSAFHLVQHAKRSEVPIYGEQVAGARVMPWIDLVWSDLEATGHTFRPFILASAGFGAPIIRQRAFWVAGASDGDGRGGERGAQARVGQDGERGRGLTSGGDVGRVAGTHDSQRRSDLAGGYILDGSTSGRDQSYSDLGASGPTGRMARSNGGDSSAEGLQRSRQYGLFTPNGGVGDVRPDEDRRSSPTNGFWGSADWLRCRDDKWRPVEPGTFPLAHGYPERVGLLRGFGNAISPIVAAEFVKAHRESEERGVQC